MSVKHLASLSDNCGILLEIPLYVDKLHEQDWVVFMSQPYQVEVEKEAEVEIEAEVELEVRLR